jgi:4-amino-4-deoxy-L-arabinose transferase-like glycosyltransferase
MPNDVQESPPEPAGFRAWPAQPWSARRLGVLLGLAALLRLTYLMESLALPFVEGPLFDSVVYLRQAESIHAGRFDDPSLLAFSPLYGWFLALFGSAPSLAPILAQLAIGTLTLYLVHRAVAALEGELAAFFAALLWTAYGLVLFYETKLMSETLGLALFVAAIAITSSASFRSGRAAYAASAGVLLALAILARASLLLVAPFVAASAFVAWSREEVPDRHARLRRGLVLAASLACVLGLHGLHNFAQTGLFVPVILVSNTAAQASRSSWSGSFGVFGEAPSAWDVVDQARDRLARAERGEPEPPRPSVDVIGVLSAAPGKAALTFRDTETTFDYGYYGERSEVRVFTLLPLSFGALAILALIGSVLLVRARGWRPLVPHLAIVLGVLALTTIFHPSSRYRLPMIVPLVMLAASALARFVRAEKRARAYSLAGVAVLVIGFAVPTYAWRLRRPAMWHVQVAESAAEAGRVEQAVERAARARALAGGDEEVETRLERLNVSGELER